MGGGGWVSTHEDITERRRAEAALAFMARHDALTELPNRTLFQERLIEAIAVARRGPQCALLCLDLDHFKAINDTLGHPVGDNLLRAVADRLSAAVRNIDTVARLGGDEFAIIQTDLGSPDHAAMLANRIITALREPFDIDGHRVVTGTSIGIAIATRDGTSSDTLLMNADIALYLAKAEGRGTFRFFEPEMDRQVQARRKVEMDLRNALQADEFDLHYQPVLDLQSGRVAGFEALIRWNHPARGMVSPGDFIPIAEETGLIIPIGEWVLRRACLDAAAWPRDVEIAVNLSPAQFKGGQLLNSVRQALAISRLDPNRLELEITESVLLQNSEDTLTLLHQLRGLGIRIALDDFGTGYSSLGYLRSFPFDKIKIDRTFVRDIDDNAGSAVIVGAVVGIARALGMTTVAEGVETANQLAVVGRQGCALVQGYLFSRPRPVGDVPALIRSLHIADQGQIVEAAV
jgi:diguanylate cyclase (GGDEF)-like protein